MLLFVLLGAPPVRAEFPPTPAQAILSSAASPAILRARIDSLARALEADHPLEAGEARHYEGMSFHRAGKLDSAITAYARAYALRADRADLLTLADARLLRAGAEDGAATLRLLLPLLAENAGEPLHVQARLYGQIAWAHFLAGHPDSAALMFSNCEELLGRRMEWRYRMGRAALASGHAQPAFDFLYPVAVASRLQDADTFEHLAAAAERIGAGPLLRERLERELYARDAREQRLFESWGGRRLRFTGTDGFPLVGIALPARGPGRPPGAVVLMAAGDTIAIYDSLVVALRNRGYAAILVPCRGSNWAVAPSCPLPDAWEGREESLQHQAARDVPRALRALAGATPLDTTRMIVVGVQGTVPIAAEAARDDPRVRALLLVGPSLSPVERGAVRANLARAGVPAFFQIAPEEFAVSYDVTDLLYQASNRAASRVVESTSSGRGIAQLRSDPALVRRILDWLPGALKSARGAPSRSPR